MLYTKIDCRYFSLPQSELKIPASFVTINPEAKPGSLVLAGSSAFSKNIGAQVACKLSLEHFIEGTLEFFKNPKEAEILPQQSLTQALLEAAFRRANISVYEFGHKLSAGGRMAASLIGLVIKDNLVTAGRVGSWSAYLLRAGQLFPFFDEQSAKNNSSNIDSFLGSKSMVTIETAEVPLSAEDKIFVFSETLDDQHLRLLALLSEDFFTNKQNLSDLVNDLFVDKESMPIVLLAEIGPESVYLSKIAD